MKPFKEIEGKEVLSSDGRVMGKLTDLIYSQEYRPVSLIVKMNKDILEELGEDKPIFSSVRLKIDIDHVKAFSDNIVLNKALDDLHIYFHVVEEESIASELVGNSLSGSEGRDVGKVLDILVDTGSWGPLSMLVKINKEMVEELNQKRSFLSKTKMGISMKHVTDVGDIIMLDTTAEEMGDIINDVPIKKM